MVKAALFLGVFAGLLSAHIAFAEDEEPDPVAWFHELSGTPKANIANSVRGFTVGCTDKRFCKMWQKILSKINTGSLLRFVPQEVVDFTALLNPDASGDAKATANTDNAGVQLKFQDLGTSVKVQIKSNDKFVDGGTWKINDSDRASADGALNWISANLGYHAIVLDIREPFILVGLNAPKQKGNQGVVLRDSSMKGIVSKKSQKGKALIQAGRSAEYLGVFQALVGKEGTKEPIVVGDKIMFNKGTAEAKPTAPAPAPAPAPASPAPESSAN